MIIKYKGPRTVDKMEQTDIAGRRSFSSGNGRRNYIELRTAVGEAGVERGLALRAVPRAAVVFKLPLLTGMIVLYTLKGSILQEYRILL